jgi:hypothetical protein
MDTVKGPKSKEYPTNPVVHNNLIHNIGLVEKQTAGVQISMAMNIRVSHNSIYDVPRAGINVSEGTWGGHIIEYNDVFNTVRESSDHGAFNSWGRDRFWHPDRKTMDKITECEGNIINGMPDLLNCYQGNNWKGAIQLLIVRNQREKAILLETK